MTDAGYYRGTTADQDNRFQDKEKKLMKTLKFNDTLNEPVDMRKVKLDALKPWITEKLTEILGFEDDVVIDYAINQLESTNTPHPKSIQINLTGFLNAKNARAFMGELWPMLVSAMKNPHGIPDSLIEAKRAEMEANKTDEKKMAEFQSNIETIKDQLAKDRKEEKSDRRSPNRRSPDRRSRERVDRREKRDKKERSRERERRRGSRERRRSRDKKRSRSRERKRRSRSRERRRRTRSRERKSKRERKSRSRSPRKEDEKRREKSKSKSRERDVKREISPASNGSEKME